jgi:hypothetical protein
MLHFLEVFMISLLLPYALGAWEISHVDAEIIGKRIYANECSNKQEKLVWWNEGEHFASLGIGHFIWYPENSSGPFEETFPALLAFLNANGIESPDWLKQNPACPWQSKIDYSDRRQENKKKDLQTLLAQSIPLQTQFIAKRFESIVPDILGKFNGEQRDHARKQIERIAQSLQGKYALLDYLNFKGSGIAESERYRGAGWGLKQVLEKMPNGDSDPLIAFAETAKTLLKQRVRNAPPERNEERWLAGWLARVDTYTKVEK